MMSLMLATTMMAMDQTIANVALPNIQGSLSASQDQASWILTSYIVCSAIAVPVLGWICGRMGRKRVFLAAVATFSIASVACGLAGTIGQIVLFRAIQGISGAALMPLSQAILLDIYPVQEHRSAMTIWGLGAIMGPIMGPVVGGWITDTLDWRWVFFINVPISIIAFAGIAFCVAETKTSNSQRLDVFGFLTLGLGVGACQLMLDRGETKDWFGSTEIWTEAILAALAFYLFIAHSLTTKKPFINPVLFRDRNFVFTAFAGILQSALFVTVLSLQPSFFQDLLGYPVLLSGWAMAPRGVGILVGSLVANRLRWVDFRVLIISGFLITSFGIWQMTQFSLSLDLMPILSSGLIQGIGAGFVFGTISSISFSTLPAELRTEGAGVYWLIRNFGTSIAISLVETRFSEHEQLFHSYLSESIRPDNPLAHAPFAPPGAGFSTLGLMNFDAAVGQQAAMLSYIDGFRMISLAALLAIPFVLMLQKPPATTMPVTAE